MIKKKYCRHLPHSLILAIDINKGCVNNFKMIDMVVVVRWLSEALLEILNKLTARS